jgi:hypothetical protein
MISKQQIKDAVPFTYKSLRYTIKNTLDNHGDYYVVDFAGYVGNVLKIGTKSFTMFTFVMGKKVMVKVNYSECEPVIAG